ncbi:MAG: HEAT repeat domain-containing protein [Myxococcota bacterium]
MDPLNLLYDQVAAGEAQPPRDYNEYKRMIARARSAARGGDADARLAGVAVLEAINTHWAHSALREFLRDDSPTVRARLLRAAVTAGEAGLGLLRELARDTDPSLALEAVGYLGQVPDRGAASAMRRLLTHDDPRLRAAAAEVLGNIAGPGLVIALQRLVDDDPDAQVRDAAALAARRINGEQPKSDPAPWWQDPDQDTTAWTPAQPIDAPDELPRDAQALAQLLGQVRDTDQMRITEAFAACGESEMRTALRAAQPNKGRDLNVGIAVAARRLGREDWGMPIRRLLLDEDPGVRIAAADTLGAIGKVAAIIPVRDLLSDTIPAVRYAGLRALDQLVNLDELQRYTYLLKDEQDPDVLAMLYTILNPEE